MKHILTNDKKNSPFSKSGFMQLNLKYFYFLRKLAKANSTAMQLFLFLMENCNYLNEIQISQKEISQFLGISTRYVIKNVKFLKEINAINVIRTDKRTENTYILNPRICWGSYGYNVTKCKYDKNKTVLDPISLKPYLNEIKKIENEKEITRIKIIKKK